MPEAAAGAGGGVGAKASAIEEARRLRRGMSLADQPPSDAKRTTNDASSGERSAGAGYAANVRSELDALAAKSVGRLVRTGLVDLGKMGRERPLPSVAYEIRGRLTDSASPGRPDPEHPEMSALL